jgi:thioredoxin-related protein
MKKEVLSDPQVINLVNENFFPVMINGKSKKPIVYNEKKYINDVSIEEDPKSTWRHNLFFELVAPTNNNHYWPTIVILNGKHEKQRQFPGFQSKPQLLRNLNRIK